MKIIAKNQFQPIELSVVIETAEEYKAIRDAASQLPVSRLQQVINYDSALCVVRMLEDMYDAIRGHQED